MDYHWPSLSAEFFDYTIEKKLSKRICLTGSQQDPIPANQLNIGNQKAPKNPKRENKRSLFLIISGVGGIRTLVQTSNTQAFYMLILLLVFDWRQRADTQLPAYLLRFSNFSRSV